MKHYNFIQFTNKRIITGLRNCFEKKTNVLVKLINVDWLMTASIVCLFKQQVLIFKLTAAKVFNCLIPIF